MTCDEIIHDEPVHGISGGGGVQQLDLSSHHQRRPLLELQIVRQ